MGDTLYIVGNGFDMHHELPTSYWHFGEYLKEHNSELYDLLSGYIGYPVTDKDLWKDFEANLARLDVEELLSSGSDYLPDYASDDFRDRDRYSFNIEMERHVEMLTKELLSEFRNFILAVEIGEETMERRIRLDRDARFLSFNYTNTLGTLYNIARSSINFIHHSAHDEGTPIILGHGIDPKQLEYKRAEPPAGLSDEDMERWREEQSDQYDHSYELGQQTMYGFFRSSFKPTVEIIGRNTEFFASLAGTEQVVIMGHSLSDVDMKYFVEIAANVKEDCRWKVSYRDDGDDVKFAQTLTGLGIDPGNITVFKLADEMENGNQLEMEM